MENHLSRSRGALAILIGGLLLTAITVNASSPDAWKQHQQEVTAKCLTASGLRNAKPAGQIVGFSDDVGYDAMLIQGNYPQPHMNNQVGRSLCLFNRKTRQVHHSEADQFTAINESSQSRQKSYKSNRGFQFQYPEGYVVESKKIPDQVTRRAIEVIDLWTQRDHDRIQAGTFQNSELPANINVTVLQNPKRLPLKIWALQSNQFVSPKNFQSLSIANQTAISFSSTGLYEHETVVVPKPKSSEVVVISFAKLGIPQNDRAYQPAFQQILSTFKFTAQ